MSDTFMISSAQRLKSRKRTAKKQRQYRNKQQVERTKENKKKLCIEIHDFFLKRQKNEVGWWWLLGY